MIKMTMNTGEEMELSISHVYLKRVEKERPESAAYTERYYEQVGGVTISETRDVLERAYEIVYVGYLCGLAKNGMLSDALDYDAFEAILPEDDTLIVTASSALVSPNRTRDFEAYLSEQRTRQKAASKSRNSR